ncbi:hypothetical protein IFM89_001070 [Coptis chinensis]|uniref:F-box domain-containing protein n=1 Tax=Coptis chinensis TaxID=261450 RepID=A0A835GWT0_9MAGN|nr:hypothetical protein IFM89_001070 [Coptis chinensis]
MSWNNSMERRDDNGMEYLDTQAGRHSMLTGVEYYHRRPKRYSKRKAETEYSDYRHRRHHHRREKIAKTNYDNDNNTVLSVEIPSEIMSNILLRLPIKSLVRFLAVSKNWYNLIRDSDFIDLAYKQHQGKDGWVAIKIPFKKELHGEQLKIAATCNGLLCLVSKYDFRLKHPIIIYNPITKETLTLPKLDLIETETEDSENTRTTKGALESFIITLGQTSWRKLHLPCENECEFTVSSWHNRNSAFFNGVIYWILERKRGYGFINHILAFDENCRVIMFNDTSISTSFYYGRCTLVGFGEYLALIGNNEQMPIWRLVDDNRGTWIHHSTQQMFPFKNFNGDSSTYNVVDKMGDDSLLLSDYYHYFFDHPKQHLVLYHPKTGSLHIDFVSGVIPRSFDVLSFVPSFVSLNI